MGGLADPDPNMKVVDGVPLSFFWIEDFALAGRSLFSQTLHGTAIYADQLGWFWVSIWAYMAYMECLGLLGARRKIELDGFRKRL